MAVTPDKTRALEGIVDEAAFALLGLPDDEIDERLDDLRVRVTPWAETALLPDAGMNAETWAARYVRLVRLRVRLLEAEMGRG